MNQKTNASRYRIVWWCSLLLFIALMTSAPRLAASFSNEAIRIALYLSPMVFLLILWGTGIRKILHTDEFIRKTTLEHAGVVAFVTAGWTYAYGLLEYAGYPKLSMMVVTPVMAGVWLVLNVVERLRNRIDEE